MKKLSDQWELINEARRLVPVDLHHLASNLGVRLRAAFLHPKISGMIERLGENEFTITVNHSDAHTRQRFTIAHELGHYMLHRHLIGDGLDDDRAYRSTQVGKYHNTSIGPSEETEANRFAANLLMPQSLVDAEWQARNDVSDMADYFGVSAHAMSIRLGVPYDS
ncbi:MAG: ImmA/IrrE family metallo-endopeptidase [Silicimonas sp.]|nr:ImmA/IrrE family metallo-endopeptidase [Silicimonas sp.]